MLDYFVLLTCPGCLVEVDGDGVVVVEEGGVGGGAEGHTHPIAETARAHTDRREYLLRSTINKYQETISSNLKINKYQIPGDPCQPPGEDLLSYQSSSSSLD